MLDNDHSGVNKILHIPPASEKVMAFQEMMKTSLFKDFGEYNKKH
jgi:hypothetical protein